MPTRIFEIDEYAAIRSILGNDVYINSYIKNDVITPNDCYIINVEYTMIDLNTFDIFKVKNPKRINSNSGMYVVEHEGKLIKLLISNPKEEFWIKIYSCKQETTEESIVINYYGEVVESELDILHNYLSNFGSKILSYHGTELKTSLNLDEKLKSEKKIVPEYETEYLKSLTSFSRDYVSSVYNTKYFKDFDMNNILPVINLGENVGPHCIVDFNNHSINELRAWMNKLKTGIIMLTNQRNPLSLIYIQNPDYTLNENLIDYTILTICLDIENCNKFKTAIEN